MDSNTVQQTNPLLNYMRQPKIYIKLPSEGKFWPNGSLEPSDTGEYAVYSMTAKDELLLKVPDALMNGQAIVDVIQSCIPNIKDAWQTPSIDLDVILIAIRLATYGEKMSTPIDISEDYQIDYTVDLRITLDELIRSIGWVSEVVINDELTVFVRPMNYTQISKTANQTFETQKLMQIVNDVSIKDEDKVVAFKASFGRLTEVTIGIVAGSVYRVDTPMGSTSDPKHIEEFVGNMDKNIFTKIQDHLEKLKDQNSIKPITITVTEEMAARGAKGETIEFPLVFDPATFFV